MQLTPTPWPTPTLRPVIEATGVIQFPTGMEYVIADEVIQGYHTANSQGTLDMVMTIFLILIVLWGLWGMIHQVKEL